MPFQLLDLILAGIMLLSGILALMRGFTREVLSVLAWGLAAVAAYFAVQQPNLLAIAKPYVEKDILAQVSVGAVAFLLVLIIASVISVKISDAVVDSSAGAVDRTLGFVFGLARGLVLVAIAYLFYGWLVPPDRQDAWVKDAKSLPLVRSTGSILLSLMPPNMVETLSNSALNSNSDAATDGQAPAAGQSGRTNPPPVIPESDSNTLDNLSNGASQQSN
jgi:membrane protein required for colicin V production